MMAQGLPISWPSLPRTALWPEALPTQAFLPSLHCDLKALPAYFCPHPRLSLTEISLTKSSAHLILSQHLLLRGSEPTTSILSGKVRKLFQRVQKWPIQWAVSSDSGTLGVTFLWTATFQMHMDDKYNGECYGVCSYFCHCVCFQPVNFKSIIDKRGLCTWKHLEPPGWMLTQGPSGLTSSAPCRGRTVEGVQSGAESVCFGPGWTWVCPYSVSY